MNVAPKRMSVYECLEDISKQGNRAAKVKYLQEHCRYNPLGIIFKFAYHPDWKATIPRGKTDFRPWKDGEGDMHLALFQNTRRLYIFCEPPIGPDNISEKALKMHWQGILGSITEQDANLLIMAKDGKLPFQMTEAFVREAYPDLLPPLPVKIDGRRTKVVEAPAADDTPDIQSPEERIEESEKPFEDTATGKKYKTEAALKGAITRRLKLGTSTKAIDT